MIAEPWRRPSGRGGLVAVIAVLVAVSLLAALMGAAAGLGSLLFLLPFAAVLGGVVVAFSPVPALIWGLVVLSLLAVGPAIYFAKVDAARWVVPAIGLGLLLPALLHVLSPGDQRSTPGRMPRGFAVLWLFLGLAALSTAINRSAPGDWVAFARLYLLMVPPIVLLAFGGLDARHWKWIWLFYVGAAVLQFPVAALQHFVFAARQVRSADWDAVVGTFPGQSEGGGASAAMGVYLVVAVVFALMLWRHRQLRWYWAALAILSAVGAIALAEVKAVVLLLGLAMLVTFADRIRRHPVQFMAVTVVALAAMAGLLEVYGRIHYGDKVVMGQLTAPRSPLEAIRNQFDPDRESFYTGEMGRAASFVHWWNVNGHADTWRDALLGHGGGATQFSRFNLGELVARYRHPLNQTGTGALLWEVGLLGHLLLVVGLGMVSVSAWRLAARPGVDDLHQALLKAAALSIACFVVTLPYKSFLFGTAPAQVLFAMLLGYVAHAHRMWGTSLTPQAQRLQELRRASVGFVR